MQGVPFYFDFTLRLFYNGNFWQLINPFAILCGLVSLSMILMHGGLYLANKVEEPVSERALKASRIFTVIMLILFTVGGEMIASSVYGYVVTESLGNLAPSNPLYKIPFKASKNPTP